MEDEFKLQKYKENYKKGFTTVLQEDQHNCDIKFMSELFKTKDTH